MNAEIGDLALESWPGSGRSWLLLHGFTGAPQAWAELARAVAGRAHLAAPYLPGHGPAPWQADSFSDAVDRLAALASGIEPRPRAIAGYSLGGRLALALLARHPGLFSHAVLIGASAGLAAEDERRQRRAADAALAARLRQHGVAAFLDAWEALPLFASQARLPKARLAAQRALRAAHTAEGLAHALEALGLGVMPDLWPALPGVRARVVLVAGEEDAKFRALGQAMARLLPDATMTVVPGSGHNVLLEAPEALAEVLLGAGE